MSYEIKHWGDLKWLAWCPQCQEGYRGTLGDAENWGAQHDGESHPE